MHVVYGLFNADSQIVLEEVVKEEYHNISRSESMECVNCNFY